MRPECLNIGLIENNKCQAEGQEGPSRWLGSKPDADVVKIDSFTPAGSIFTGANSERIERAIGGICRVAQLNPVNAPRQLCSRYHFGQSKHHGVSRAGRSKNRADRGRREDRARKLHVPR